MEIDLSQFHQVFFEESLEGLELMERELLALEEDSDRETINTIFRAAHSIKGGSATFGFQEVSEFTHWLETLLDEMREGQRKPSKEIVDFLLRSVDCLREMIANIQEGKSVGDSHKELMTFVTELLGVESNNEDVCEEDNVTVAQNVSCWKIVFRPEAYILQTGNEPARMFRELAEFGELKVTAIDDNLPDFDVLEPESCYLAWELNLKTKVDEAQIRAVFEWVEDDCELIIQCMQEQEAEQTSAVNNKEDAQKESQDIEHSKANDLERKDATQLVRAGRRDLRTDSAKKGDSAIKAGSAKSIRVGIDKIDKLIDMVGELVITQSMLSEVGNHFDMSKIGQLIAGLADLEQNTRELQEAVMSVRMLPIGFIFNRMPRMVRDLSTQLGKDVELEIVGESTELDKTVLEQMADPLNHLVRNAIDHGIELPQQRLDAGKTAFGTITLRAYHQGGNIVIEINDDGKGIDADAIYSKAIDKGILPEGTELNHKQKLALIFEPGFSTAEVVTDVSGRGVGMDVVKRNINSLGGSIEIKSELGVGTSFVVRLPLTLAILDGQLIRVANEVMVLPLITVIESIPTSRETIQEVAGDLRVYEYQDEFIPVVDLKTEFGLNDKSNASQDIIITIVHAEHSKLALIIDELLAQQQVVIKSLETHYKAIQGIAGATILGSGEVALILDVSGLAKRIQNTLMQSERELEPQ